MTCELPRRSLGPSGIVPGSDGDSQQKDWMRLAAVHQPAGSVAVEAALRPLTSVVFGEKPKVTRTTV